MRIEMTAAAKSAAKSNPKAVCRDCAGVGILRYQGGSCTCPNCYGNGVTRK